MRVMTDVVMTDAVTGRGDRRVLSRCGGRNANAAPFIARLAASSAVESSLFRGGVRLHEKEKPNAIR